MYVILRKIFIGIVNKKRCVKSQSKMYVIIKRYLLKSRIKNPCVKPQSPVKISVPYYKYFLRKSALHKHYFNIEKIGLSGAP